MNDFFEKNLNNINIEYDLFNNPIEKLSMKNRIGFLPISIWEPNWQIVKKLKEIIGDDGQAREMAKHNYNFRSIGFSGKDVSQKISIFNPHLAQMILSAYCPKNAEIFDPFAGGGTRGFIATAMEHNYLGIELRQEEVDRIKNRQEILNKYFDIFCDDSRTYNIQENFFDFSYTCPPYYNLEIYSDLENDLSNAKTYKDFLVMIKDSMNTTYKGLKKDCLSVWVVGNFRDKEKNLIHFNGDIVKIALECGFKFHDELIFWGASKNAVQRSGQFVANRRSVRVHEYILIFKK